MKSFKREAFMCMFMFMGILPECMSVQDVHAVPVEVEKGTGPLEMEGQTNASSSVDAENWACPLEEKAVLS